MEDFSWWSFLLIFVRITSFMVIVPLFSGQQVPNTYKIGISFVLTVLCFGVINDPIENPSMAILISLIIKEFFIGIFLGFIPKILLYAVQIAGSMLDIPIGFSMATLFDPSSGINVQLSGHFKNILAMLLLLATDGHHLLIQGILVSFDWVSLGTFVPSFTDGSLSTLLIENVKQMFIIGFMIAAPIIGIMFLMDIALGIMAKTVPQMNIFAVFPPIKLLLHFSVYMILLPSFFYLLKVLFETMFESMYAILKILGG